MIVRGVCGGFVVFVVLFACGAREPSPVTQPPSLEPLESLDGDTAVASATLSASETLSNVAPVADSLPCPTPMVLVEGEYCPKVRQECKRWLAPPGPYHDYRCAEYAPSVCLVPRAHKRFCVDREEYVASGDALPLVHQSWTTAFLLCRSRRARLCLESEWQFACEGEELRPYPYGFERDSAACNIDQMNLGKPQAGLNDLRAPVDAYPRCLSPFGVHDMSGNVEEWVTLDYGSAPERSAMKGAWWLPGKNTCRAATLGHGEVYEGPQVGVRCCQDAGP